MEGVIIPSASSVLVYLMALPDYTVISGAKAEV
jgi:hypothetical protein